MLNIKYIETKNKYISNIYLTKNKIIFAGNKKK